MFKSTERKIRDKSHQVSRKLRQREHGFFFPDYCDSAMVDIAFNILLPDLLDDELEALLEKMNEYQIEFVNGDSNYVNGGRFYNETRFTHVELSVLMLAQTMHDISWRVREEMHSKLVTSMINMTMAAS
jgi:hypothetical protein